MPETGRSAPSNITVEPELRRVTVLFADIQGSTALIQDLDAEDAANLIDPALNAMIEAAERFNGAISHRGDGIMAVFGAPTMAEDHGLRACLAALAMRDAVAIKGGTAGVRLRIGIHTGPVVFRPVRIGGTLMHDAVGIAVHTAARLEQSAIPGTICLSDTARDLARGYITTEPLDPILVKGIDVPIQRFALLGADLNANRWTARAARGLTRFVGRRKERAALAAAARRGGLRAIHLVGPAGIGKSRLIHDLLQSDAARNHHAILLTGDHLRRFAPFHPVTAWLRAWLGIREADDTADARAKLAAGLAALGRPVAADRARLTRLIGLGAPAHSSNQRIDFGATVAAVMAARAGTKPILLICEDADSFDPAMLDLLESALPVLAENGVLLVSSSRTKVRFPGIPRPHARTLYLGPLPDADATALLDAIDPQVATRPPALAAEILRKAGGNPLFIEEVAPLVLANRKSAGLTAGGPRADSNDTDLPDIPDRVEELIADRMNRLSPDARRLIQLSAVIGPDVPLRLLAPLSGLTPASLQDALHHLAEQQLLYESRKYPDPQYSFKHALTRDVAYRNVLAARRRTLHGRVADILAAEGDAAITRNIDDLCHHALRAQRWDQAVSYLRIAAREAQSRTAFSAAMAALRRAREVAATLELTPENGRIRLDLLQEFSQVAHGAGSYTEMATALDEAEKLSAEIAIPVWPELLQERLHLYNILGRLDEAIDLGERARKDLLARHENRLAVRFSFVVGQAYFNAGRLDQADRTLQEALDIAAAARGKNGPAGMTDDQVATQHTLIHATRAMTRIMRGDETGAIDDLQSAGRAATASPRAYDRLFVDATTGFVACELRQASEAIDHFERVLAIAESTGIVQLTPPALAGLGHAQLMLGQTETASQTLAEAHRLAKADQRWMHQIIAGTGMALTALDLHEPDLADTFAREAIALADKFGFRAFGVRARRIHGTVTAMTAGQEISGHAKLLAALAAADKIGLRPEAAHTCLTLAAVHAPNADTFLAEARHRYTDLGMAWRLPALEAALAENRLPYI